MATVVCHNLGSNATSGTGTSYTTVQICPQPNRLTLIAIANRSTGTADQPSVTGCGVTWNVESSVAYDATAGATRRLTVLSAQGAGAVSGALTITFGTSQNGIMYSISDYGHADLVDATVQAVSSSGTATSGSVTLAAFGNVENATYGAFAHTAQEQVTAGTGFTKIHGNNGNFAFLGQGFTPEYKNTNDTGVDASWTTSSAWGGIAIEIKAGTAPATPTGLPTVMSESSAGTPIYVSYLSGNDTTGAGTSGNPYKTLDKAITTLSSGNINTGKIYLKYDGGSTHQPLSGERTAIAWCGKASTDPIHIETDPADSPNYATGANMAKFLGEIGVGLAGSSGQIYGNWRIRNLEIVQQAFTDRASTAGDYGVRIENARNIEVSKCRIHNNNQGGILATGSVVFMRCENLQVFKNRIYDTGSSGAVHNASENHDHAIYWGGQSAAGVYGGAIYNNLLYRLYHGFTVHMWGSGGADANANGTDISCKHTVCAFNTCYDTATTGANSVSILGGGNTGAVQNVVTSNILVKSGAGTKYAMEWANNGSGNLVKFNLPFQIGSGTTFDPAIVGTVSSNLVSGDPVFTDAANGDFRISSSSPAKNAGEAGFMPADDYAGTTRTTTDIGAFAASAAAGASGGALLVGRGRMGRRRRGGVS